MLEQTIGKSSRSPCYKCEKREPGCHAKCADYAAWKEANDKKKAEEAVIRHKDLWDERALNFTNAKRNRLRARRKK